MEMKPICTAVTRLRGRLVLHHRRFCSGGVSKPAEQQEIVIPTRIERGPTDILRALSSTISRDYTAAHYKYHDDPYLMPNSNIGKRTFALAKESGRKAAQWIQSEHSRLFNANVAQPPIPALMPKVQYGEDSEVTEEDLTRMMGEVRVSDALTVAELLNKQGKKVSVETQMAFLQFLCFHNAEDTIAEDLLEERWFRQGQHRGLQRKTWKDKGAAEQVYAELLNELPKGDPRLVLAKCALLRGMTKYCQVDKAWELYREMRELGEPMDTVTVNGVIRVAPFLKESNEARWELVEDLLKDMAARKLSPDLGTLNAALEVLLTTASWHQSRTLALRVLAEFKSLGITPSLASYYFLLVTFCRERGPRSNILEEILTELEKQDTPLTIRDTKDVFFFVTAMEVCHSHLGDPALARRLHALLHRYDNYDLIGDSFKESIYYRHLFMTLCTLEPLDSFLEFYDKYVPNIYIPEPTVMMEIIRSVQLHEAWALLPRLWSDLMIFDQIDRENLVTSWLSSAVDAQKRISPTEPETEESELATALCKSVAQLWERIEGQSEMRTNPMRWSGPMLGYALQLAVRADEFTFACQLLGKLRDASPGAPPALEALQEFLNAAVAKQTPDKAVACVEFAIDAGYPEAALLARDLREKMELSEKHIAKLDSMLGTMAE